MISYMISPLPSTCNHVAALAGADISPAIRTDNHSDSDRVMDSDEERDFADQALPQTLSWKKTSRFLLNYSNTFLCASTLLILSYCYKTFQCIRLW
jgi:hypothetical protein